MRLMKLRKLLNEANIIIQINFGLFNTYLFSTDAAHNQAVDSV